MQNKIRVQRLKEYSAATANIISSELEKTGMNQPIG
jgi:hypothetical protein